MTTKTLVSQSVKCLNRFSIQNLSMDLVELSEIDLQQIVGGFGQDALTADAGCPCCSPPPPPCGCHR
jgi:hypothetical protein